MKNYIMKIKEDTVGKEKGEITENFNDL